jgi:very-short-patch-repair endonuclease
VRTAFLSSRGFRVLGFWSDDILLRSNAVLEAILAALPAPHPNPLPAGGERGLMQPARALSRG